MVYRANEIARYFIRKAQKEGGGLSHMKVQKLVYFAHGWWLGIKKKPLIHEKMQAWNYGPVIVELYHELKHYGPKPIPYEDEHVPYFEGEYLKLLEKIWEVYGGETAFALSGLSHATGAPWEETIQKEGYSAGNIPSGVEIPNDLIQEYFYKLGEKNTQKQAHK